MSALLLFPEEVVAGTLAAGDALAVTRRVSLVARYHRARLVRAFMKEAAKRVAVLKCEHGDIAPAVIEGYIDRHSW